MLRMGSSAVWVAVCGALVAQLLPFTWPQLPVARAFWCWDVQPPVCDAPTVSGGSCEEGATIPAGKVCTPVCEDGKVPSCDKESVQCPPSIRGDNDDCTPDIQRSSSYADLGTFTCVEPGSDGFSPCGNVTGVVVEDNIPQRMDAGTLGLLGGLLVLLALGAVLVRLPAQDASRVLFKSGPMEMTLANILGLLLVIAGLIAYCVGLAVGRTALEAVFILGLAAGICSSLPLWWACYRAGVHSAVKMSREAAWRIHIVFGDLTLVFGTVHGIFAMTNDGIDVWSHAFFVLGFVGLLLMWLGVLPATLHHLLPKVVSYDTWKLLHYLSMLGYVLSLVHMMEHAVKFKTARSIAVTTVNVLALVVLVGQKLYSKFSTPKAVVKSAEVIEEPCGKHIFLRLGTKGFRPQPGQWGYLSAPSISPVPHPFTVVPTDEREVVQLFVKVAGKFTRGLAEGCSGGMANVPKLSLEGPYGEPPIPSLRVDAVVFVLGGVGVTPSLTLASEARKMCGDKVAVYWALRSPGLLRRCAPMLEPAVNPRLTCVRLSGGTSDGSALPLEAKEGSEDVGDWLANTAADLSNLGAQAALLFICGPAPLVSAAKAATARKATSVKWHVHVEQFLFLPKPPTCGKRSGGHSQVAAKVQPNSIGAAQG